MKILGKYNNRRFQKKLAIVIMPLFLLGCGSSNEPNKDSVSGAGSTMVEQMLNGSFENGFSPWVLTPNNLGKIGLKDIIGSIGSVTPPHGTQMVKITLGNVNGDFVDFNFLHSDSFLLSSGHHVRFKMKILYENIGNEDQGVNLSCGEVILKEPNAGQPLIAVISINTRDQKSIVTNMLTGQTQEDFLIQNGPSGFSYETAWLNVDIDVSLFAGQSVPISFFLNGTSRVREGETMVYLLDEVSLAP